MARLIVFISDFQDHLQRYEKLVSHSFFIFMQFRLIVFTHARVPFIYCKSKCRVNDLKQQFAVLYIPFKFLIGEFVYINV